MISSLPTSTFDKTGNANIRQSYWQHFIYLTTVKSEGRCNYLHWYSILNSTIPILPTLFQHTLAVNQIYLLDLRTGLEFSLTCFYSHLVVSSRLWLFTLRRFTSKTQRRTFLKALEEEDLDDADAATVGLPSKAVQKWDSICQWQVCRD